MKLRVAILGCGQIAANAHAPYYLAHPDVELVAVVDPDAGKRVALAQRFGVTRNFSSLEALLTWGEVDAVSICVPPRLHASLTVEALRGGLHVLCEKPAATNVADVQLMAQVAHETGGVLTFGFHYRYLPEVETVKRLVDEKLLGDIYSVELKAMRRRGIPLWGNFIDRRVAGGGPLLDIGVHLVDMGLWLAGFPQPREALGVTHHQLISREVEAALVPASELVEDMATGLITCDNGLSVRIDASFLANIDSAEVTQARLLGSDGGVEVFPPRLVQQVSAMLGTTDLVMPGRAWDHQVAYERQINRFVAAALGREPVLVTPEQAVLGQRAIDLVYESAATRRPVSAELPVQVAMASVSAEATHA